jgi:hypothetical protein
MLSQARKTRLARFLTISRKSTDALVAQIDQGSLFRRRYRCGDPSHIALVERTGVRTYRFGVSEFRARHIAVLACITRPKFFERVRSYFVDHVAKQQQLCGQFSGFFLRLRFRVCTVTRGPSTKRTIAPHNVRTS